MAKSAPIENRIFNKTTNLMHDLIKLGVAHAKKYIGFAEDGHKTRDPERFRGEWVTVEHCHFFHSIDSRGRPQDKSTPTNGHFHEMTIIKPGTDTSPAVYKFGPPKKFVFDKMSNRKIIVAVPFDDHTHEPEYIRSGELKPRNLSAEAAQRASVFIANNTLAEPPPIPGITG